jgi:hypothetical protein
MNGIQELLGLYELRKPRIFVSFHHEKDQYWYDFFTKIFGDTFALFTDTSLERKVDSYDTDYVRCQIRENNITGSSMTKVLCGAETWKRRWVDWEIKATLNKKHALLGIVLPTNKQDVNGQFQAPQRLVENINSGFAHWIYWPQIVGDLSVAINEAQNRSHFSAKIINIREAMQRSLS